jgi:hypothetical protein
VDWVSLAQRRHHQVHIVITLSLNEITLSLNEAGSARLGSARLGSARLGSARLGSARLGSARLGAMRPSEPLSGCTEQLGLSPVVSIMSSKNIGEF